MITEYGGAMTYMNDNTNSATNNSGSSSNLNPDNEYQNSIPRETEIDQPQPSTATPSFPHEMPVREGK